MLNVSGMFLRVYLFVEGRRSRVEGSMSRVDRKNLKNKWRVDISIHISSTCWVGRGREGGGGRKQNTLLDNRFLNMSDCLRTSSALLTSHHIVKNVVKKFKKLI